MSSFQSDGSYDTNILDFFQSNNNNNININNNQNNTQNNNQNNSYNSNGSLNNNLNNNNNNNNNIYLKEMNRIKTFSSEVINPFDVSLHLSPAGIKRWSHVFHVASRLFFFYYFFFLIYLLFFFNLFYYFFQFILCYLIKIKNK